MFLLFVGSTPAVPAALGGAAVAARLLHGVWFFSLFVSPILIPPLTRLALALTVSFLFAPPALLDAPPPPVDPGRGKGMPKRE
jgi:hypothetical protein